MGRTRCQHFLILSQVCHKCFVEMRKTRKYVNVIMVETSTKSVSDNNQQDHLPFY
jgi:hypothetical protein